MGMYLFYLGVITLYFLVKIVIEKERLNCYLHFFVYNLICLFVSCRGSPKFELFNNLNLGGFFIGI